MKSSIRKIMVLLLTVFVITSLVACGTPETEQEGTTAKPTSGTDSVSQSNEPVTLRIITYSGEDTIKNTFAEWFEVFEDKYPWITCELECISDSNYMTTYTNRFLAGDASDIFLAKPRSFADFINAGYIMDLSKEEFINNIEPTVQLESTVNGKHYGIGLCMRPKCVFYNKDIFEANDIKIPTTQSEFWTMLDNLKNVGIVQPVEHCWAYNASVFTEHDCWLTPMAVNAEEYDVLSGVQAGNKKLADSSIFTESLQILSKLSSYCDPSDLGIDMQTSYARFAAGERPVWVFGGWIYGEVKLINPDINIGMFPFPWSEDPNENKICVGLDYGCLGYEQTKHREEVLLFLEFLTTPEAGDIFIKHTGLMSSIKGVDFSKGDNYITDFSYYIENDLIAPKYLVPEFTGQHSSIYRGMLQEYVVLPESERDPVAFTEYMDTQLSKID